jgi:membrane protease YdiL (CAAX protease family)
MSVSVFIKRHPVWTYFVMVFAISWSAVLIVVGPAGIPLATDVSEELLLFVILAMLLGPSIAGILLTGLISGKAGFRELLSRLLSWRVDIRWYVVALLTAPLLMTIVLLTLSLLSPKFLPIILVSDDRASLLLSGIVVGLVVGIFEELGWTGFAIPQLMRRHGILYTGLIVGLLWGAWHFILFWESDSFSAAFPFALLLVRLFSWLPAYRVLMVWVYDRTENLLVAMLMHASLVASQFTLSSVTLSGTDVFYHTAAWAATLWVVIVIVKVGHSKRQSL